MYQVGQWLQDGNDNVGGQTITTLAVTLSQRKYNVRQGIFQEIELRCLNATRPIL